MFIRHPNGKGKVVDSENSEVCDRSYLDRPSIVSEGSTVWNSHILHSLIQGHSIVRNATICNSTIIGTEVSGGRIDGSYVACELVTGNAMIADSRLLEETRIGHDATILQCDLRNWTIKGSAFLQGVSGDGLKGYITDGYWFAAPAVIRINDITITESVVRNGVFHVFIGCREKSAVQWLKTGPRYGRALKWKESDIDLASQFISDLLARPKHLFTYSD